MFILQNQFKDSTFVNTPFDQSVFNSTLFQNAMFDSNLIRSVNGLISFLKRFFQNVEIEGTTFKDVKFKIVSSKM